MVCCLVLLVTSQTRDLSPRGRGSNKSRSTSLKRKGWNVFNATSHNTETRDGRLWWLGSNPAACQGSWPEGLHEETAGNFTCGLPSCSILKLLLSADFDLGSGFRAPDGLCEMTGGLATPWRGAVCITEASSRLCFCPLPLSSGPRRLLLGEAGRSPNPSLVLPM